MKSKFSPPNLHGAAPSHPGSPLIVCDNLVKIYQVADLEVVALQGLDLIVTPGELLGIVGPSGSGKTTLMNILGGLDRPSAGRVLVEGENLLQLSDTALDRYRRTKVGFVWQQVARNLIPYLTARENVELPMTLAGKVGRRRQQRVDELLDVVGLADRKHHRLTELSGGEQQRVAIAVALANNPMLLLADEPTGEVDEAMAQIIYQVFNDLNQEFGLTTLIVSHDPGLARYVDRVVVIRDGKTVTETVRQIEGKPSLDVGVSTMIPEEDEAFEEFTLLDSVGRLQVPNEYLEKFGIIGRARLEVTSDGILIKPVPPTNESRSAEILADELTDARKEERLFGYLRRLFSRRTAAGK